VVLVSLGTGEHTHPRTFDEIKDWGLVAWARPILDVVFDGASDAVNYQLTRVLPPDRYWRFQVELNPGHRGFEQALQIAYGLAEDGLTNDKGIPKNLVQAAVLMELGETRVVGPIRMLVPLLKVLARWGRRRGVDAALVERYVRY